MSEKRRLTKNQILYGSLVVTALTCTVIGLGAWYNTKAEFSPENSNSTELGMGGGVNMPPVLDPSANSGNSGMVLELDSLANIGEDEFEKVKAGEFQVRGDADGSRAAALKKLANAKNITPGLFRKLAACSSGTNEELDCDGEDKAVLDELKDTCSEALNIAFSKVGVNVPKEKDIKVSLKEEFEQKSLYEIDLSALTTEESIKAAFYAISTEDFIVRVKAGDATDDQLKQSLIKAVKESGLSCEMLTRLLSKSTTPEDEPILEKLRNTVLEKALGVPERRIISAFSTIWIDFSATLVTCGDAYENGNEPSEADKESLNTKLQAAIALAQSIADPAVITDENERNTVILLKTSPLMETIYFEYFRKKLMDSIRACTTNPKDVQKIIVAMCKVCLTLFNSNFGEAFASATNIPDIQLRMLVYSDSSSTWTSKTLDLSAILSNLLLFSIEKSVRDALIVLDNQQVYKLYVEAYGSATQAYLELAIKTAASLIVDFKAYSEKKFVEESESAARLSVLDMRLSEFNTNFAQVAEIVDLQLPELVPAKTDPFSRCMSRLGEFEDLLVAYFGEPTEAKAQNLQIVLEEAQTLCEDPNVTNPPEGINQTLSEFVIAGYQELWTASLADDPVELEINRFLQAVRFIDENFLDGKKARKLLGEYFLPKLTNNLTVRNNVRETKVMWGRCRNFCEPEDHPAVAATSIEAYFERHIESSMDAAIANIAVDVSIIEDIHKDMQFFLLFKPSNKFAIFVDTASLVNFVNFKRQVNRFISAEADCRSADPLTLPILKALKNAINDLPVLGDEVADKLPEPQKKAHTLLKSLKSNIDVGLDAYFFIVYNRTLETLILAFNNGDKSPITKLITSMKLACASSFGRAYLGIVDLSSVDERLNDLKLLVVRNAFRRNASLTAEMKAGLAIALARDDLVLLAGMPANVRKLMLQLINKEALLRAYFVEENVGMKEEIVKFMKEAVAYKKLLTAYEDGAFDDQVTADLKFSELTVAYNRLRVLHGTISASLPVNPFVAPGKMDFSLPAECGTAHKQFNAVFNVFLANAIDTVARQTAKTAFELARAKCVAVSQKIKARDGSVKEIRQVYFGEFVKYVENFYSFLLTEADRSEDPMTMDLALLRHLAVTMPVDNSLLNNYKRRLEAKLVADALAADYKELFVKWQKILNVDIVNFTVDVVAERMKGVVWECFTKDKTAHANCLPILTNKVANISAMFGNTINHQALLYKILEKWITTFVITDLDAFLGRKESEMHGDLLKFKNAAANMNHKWFTQPSIKCWLNAAYYWTTSFSCMGLSIAGTYQPEYFFTSLLQQFISVKDDTLVNDALKVIRYLVMKHPNAVRAVKGAGIYILDVLRKVGRFDPPNVSLMWSAAKLFSEMSHLAPMEFALKKLEASILTPQFYAQIANASPVELNGIKTFLDGKSRALPAPRPGLDLILASFDVPHFAKLMDDFAASFTSTCKKLEKSTALDVNELIVLNDMRARVVNAAKTVKRPALIADPVMNSHVNYYAFDPSLDKIFFEYFYPQLVKEILICRTSSKGVKSFVKIMKFCCPNSLNAKCNDTVVNKATDIPDVELRLIVFGGPWIKHKALTLLNQLILAIPEDIEDGLTRFQEHQDVFEFFFEFKTEEDQNRKESILRAAFRLSADIEKYESSTFIKLEDSQNTHTRLQKQRKEFFDKNKLFPKITELAIPTLKGADSSPNGIYNYLTGIFLADLEEFMENPEAKFKSIQMSYSRAVNASKKPGMTALVCFEVSNPLEQVLKNKFIESYKDGLTKELSQSQVAKMNKKLVAAQRFDPSFYGGWTAAALLCDNHYKKLATALNNLNPADALGAKLNWKKCLCYCTPGVKPLVNDPSLLLYLEKEIDTAIKKAVLDKVDFETDLNVLSIDRKIQFLRAAEPSTRYSKYVDSGFVKAKIIEPALVAMVQDFANDTKKDESGMKRELEAFKIAVAVGGKYHVYRAHFDDVVLKCWMDAADKWILPAAGSIAYKWTVGFFASAPVLQTVDFFKLLLNEYLTVISSPNASKVHSDFVKLVKLMLLKHPQVLIREFVDIDVRLQDILSVSMVATQELIDVLKLACGHLPKFIPFKPHLDAWEGRGVKTMMEPPFYTQFFRIDLKKVNLKLFTDYLNDKSVPRTVPKPTASPGFTDELVKALPNA